MITKKPMPGQDPCGPKGGSEMTMTTTEYDPCNDPQALLSEPCRVTV
jgi:hypothetical protein